jgi:hypothetical protein
VLDRPNYLPGATPARDDLAGRADALMSFYDSETFTLIARPMEPLRERTTYAVVVTRRLKDADGRPVGSPFDFVNHTSQTADLGALPAHLPKGTTLADVAFAFTFTTQSIQSQWVAVRDGIYGQGPQAHLADTKAEVQALLPLVDTSLPKYSHRQNPYVLYAEDFALPYNLIATQLLGNDADSEATRALLEGLEYVDFVVMGSFDSPQLYDRGGAFPEAWQGFNFQSWPQDLTTKPAPVVPERVYFTLTVPRKEVSARKDGKPAPVSFISHGYTGNRFNTLDIGSHFARFGAAAIGIDCPSHGLGESAEVQAQARTLLAPFGVAPFVDAAFKGRHFDQNRDGIVDSGADFWTAYLFHTRDVVRQCGLDHVQLAKILRSFDGKTRFGFDADGDGDATNDIAGDFDGDGVVDVGGDTPIGMLGASLGGHHERGGRRHRAGRDHRRAHRRRRWARRHRHPQHSGRCARGHQPPTDGAPLRRHPARGRHHRARDDRPRSQRRRDARPRRRPGGARSRRRDRGPQPGERRARLQRRLERARIPRGRAERSRRSRGARLLPPAGPRPRGHRMRGRRGQVALRHDRSLRRRRAFPGRALPRDGAARGRGRGHGTAPRLAGDAAVHGSRAARARPRRSGRLRHEPAEATHRVPGDG